GYYSIFDKKTRRWDKYYNSAILVPPSGELDYYHKHILLPFGEYMPLGETFPFLKSVVAAVGDFSRGAGASTLNIISGGMEARFAPTICYEILKSSYVRDMVKKDANVFLNITNDSWFGKYEPMQHLALARVRSIENRRPILRSTNTGISALVDLTGQVVKRGGLGTSEYLILDVPVCDHRIRTLYNLFGYLFIYLLPFIIAGTVLLLRNKKEKRRK
ncbi:MAG: apolipoprotein N-acyltransferase, partial [Oligoflexia bacterium]|nr:apolipoprotein N-acyltransferase [Oligoflexia bacterium]